MSEGGGGERERESGRERERMSERVNDKSSVEAAGPYTSWRRVTHRQTDKQTERQTNGDRDGRDRQIQTMHFSDGHDDYGCITTRSF